MYVGNYFDGKLLCRENACQSTLIETGAYYIIILLYDARRERGIRKTNKNHVAQGTVQPTT